MTAPLSRPRIVVLDGHTLNPGDLDWSPIEAFGELTVHDRTSPGEIIERAADAEIVFTNKTPITAGTIGALPALRFIGVLATGYNVVDVAAAKARGIAVCNVPGYVHVVGHPLDHGAARVTQRGGAAETVLMVVEYRRGGRAGGVHLGQRLVGAGAVQGRCQHGVVGAPLLNERPVASITIISPLFHYLVYRLLRDQEFRALCLGRGACTPTSRLSSGEAVRR